MGFLHLFRDLLGNLGGAHARIPHLHRTLNDDVLGYAKLFCIHHMDLVAKLFCGNAGTLIRSGHAGRKAKENYLFAGIHSFPEFLLVLIRCDLAGLGDRIGLDELFVKLRGGKGHSV